MTTAQAGLDTGSVETGRYAGKWGSDFHSSHSSKERLMDRIPADTFELFKSQRIKDLKRIARHTRGEHQLTDVVNEAWVLAAKNPDVALTSVRSCWRAAAGCDLA